MPPLQAIPLPHAVADSPMPDPAGCQVLTFSLSASDWNISGGAFGPSVETRWQFSMYFYFESDPRG